MKNTFVSGAFGRALASFLALATLLLCLSLTPQAANAAPLHATASRHSISQTQANRIARRHVGGGRVISYGGVRGGAHVIHIHKGRLHHHVHVGTRTGRVVKVTRHRHHRHHHRA